MTTDPGNLDPTLRLPRRKIGRRALLLFLAADAAIAAIVVAVLFAAGVIGGEPAPGEPGSELVVNGDFSDGLTGWETLSAAGCGPPGELALEDGGVHFTRANTDGCGGTIQVLQEPKVVLKGSRLRLALDAYVTSHDLCGGGRGDGRENPVQFEVYLVDAGGKGAGFHRGFYTGEGCLVETSTQIPADTWQHFEQEYPLPPGEHTVNQIMVGGTGWDFDSRIRNVSVTVLE